MGTLAGAALPPCMQAQSRKAWAQVPRTVVQEITRQSQSRLRGSHWWPAAAATQDVPRFVSAGACGVASHVTAVLQWLQELSSTKMKGPNNPHNSAASSCRSALSTSLKACQPATVERMDVNAISQARASQGPIQPTLHYGSSVNTFPVKARGVSVHQSITRPASQPATHRTEHQKATCFLASCAWSAAPEKGVGSNSTGALPSKQDTPLPSGEQ